MYALTIAGSMVRGGVYKNILVLGGEVLSRIVDMENRSNCILFGDGAAAAIVSEVEDKNILVLGGEVLSRIVDMENRSNCILFGDGAAAAIVSEVEDGYGMLSTRWLWNAFYSSWS